MGSCHHGGASPGVTDGGVGLQIWRLAANILNKQSWIADQEWSSSMGDWTDNLVLNGERSAFKILTGKPTGKTTLGRPKHRREDNIRMDLKEIGTNTRNWAESDQDRD